MFSISSFDLSGRPAPARFGFAVLTFLIALGIRFSLESSLPPGFPFLTFFPAVIITAFVAGSGAGGVCAALCGIAAWYWFVAPYGEFGLSVGALLSMFFYVFIVAIDIALIHAMKSAVKRLEAEKAHSNRLVEQQRTMFEELQHRVANNMAFVASLLNMSRRRVEREPSSATAVIDEARQRIDTMARIHRRLHDPNSVDLPVQDYFRDLCADIVAMSGVKNVVCTSRAPPTTFDIRRLTTLSLFVTEVMTNSLKHAFPDGRPGRIAIGLAREGDEFVLSISDDGVGLPASYDERARTGMGSRIVKALAAQARGVHQIRSDGGTHVSLRFPVERPPADAAAA